MTSIEAGPECDRKVAEAIGLEYIEYDDVLTDVHYRFRPSTDWNDAMFAAEKAGLFSQWHEDYRLKYMSVEECMPKEHPNGYWAVVEIDWIDGYEEEIFAHPSGPLAICRAILALKRDA